tara:strand:- start:46 stop:321 length:276 start_codon:yes stop_codon:yes gene_type:complete
MGFKDYLEELPGTTNEGVASNAMGYRIEFELWDTTVILDAHTIDDAIKSLQKIKKSDKILAKNGDIINSKLAGPEIKKMLKQHGIIKIDNT